MELIFQFYARACVYVCQCISAVNLIDFLFVSQFCRYTGIYVFVRVCGCECVYLYFFPLLMFAYLFTFVYVDRNYDYEQLRTKRHLNLYNNFFFPSKCRNANSFWWSEMRIEKAMSTFGLIFPCVSNFICEHGFCHFELFRTQLNST